ncbi:MAG TPA: LysR substrate-binding domain-containing protein, partial [Polyangiales bacterium]|nr:LysR substrate-binding domain-containing protein [Polyangiales bacterium]
MDLHKLRTFSVVAAEGNITRAARRLSTSQPAISKQLAELEEALGTPLFHRLPRGVRLTEAGHILLRHADRIFQEEGQAESELAALSGLTRGRLTVGASTTIGSYLIPQLFGAFHRAHPEVRLELEIANTTVVQAMVLDDRIDLGLIEGFVAAEQLAAEVVHYDEMVAIAGPTHPLASRLSITARELVAYPFIGRERGSGTREVIEAKLSALSVELEPTMSLGSTEAIKRLVIEGAGFAIVSKLAVERELQEGRLLAVQVADLSIRRALHLVR